jgi:hypothetical protein
MARWVGMPVRKVTVAPRLLRSGAAILIAMAALVSSPAPAHAMGGVAGYASRDARALAEGVEYRRLVRRSGPVVVHVVSLRKDAGHSLRAVLSNDRVAGPAPVEERTSAMCQRVGCIAAVNGDFALPTGDPVGGLVAGGALLRSPVPSQHQLSVSPAGDPRAGTLSWSAQLLPSDLRPTAVTGLNVERVPDALVLYTPANGPATGTNEFGVELVGRVVEPSPPLRLEQTALVELVALVEGAGNAPIPPDGLVLSGHGKGAAELMDVWRRVGTGAVSPRALLRVETRAPVAESLGGTPVLVHEGRRWVADDGSNFVAGRHPRTIVGWNATETLLVTVDGRQPGYSVGLSLLDAADLLLAMGATEALNLDGGGSTTMVVGAAVVNRPSDRMVKRAGRQQVVHTTSSGDVVLGAVERPVASGLAIVPAGGVAPAPLDPFSGGGALLPGADPLPYDDPASIPGGGNLALIDLRIAPSPAPALVAVAAGMEVAVAQWLLTVAVLRRRARQARR